MLNLSNKYLIYKLDDYNYTYKIYDKIDVEKGRAKGKYNPDAIIYKWQDSKKYYRTLTQVLEKIRQLEISKIVEQPEEQTTAEMLNDIEALKEAIDGLKINIYHLKNTNTTDEI